MTEEEYLIDMLEYYTKDKNRRATTAVGPCVYSPTKTSEGCAIGRHLIGSLEDKKAWDCSGSISTCLDSIYRRNIKDIRPEWMKTMNTAFLEMIQNLHDIEHNWNEISGLSEEGKKELIRIIQLFNLDFTKFTKYLTPVIS